MLVQFEKEESIISRTDIDKSSKTKEMTTSLNSSIDDIIPQKTKKIKGIKMETLKIKKMVICCLVLIRRRKR